MVEQLHELLLQKGNVQHSLQFMLTIFQNNTVKASNTFEWIEFIDITYFSIDFHEISFVVV